jgi:hypothetical protein
MKGKFERDEILYLYFYLDGLFDWSCCIMLFKRLGYLIDIMLWDILILKFDRSYLLKIDILIKYVKWNKNFNLKIKNQNQ